MSTCIPVRLILTTCFKLKTYTTLFNIRDIYLICKIKSHLPRSSPINRQLVRSRCLFINISIRRSNSNGCRSYAYDIDLTSFLNNSCDLFIGRGVHWRYAFWKSFKFGCKSVTHLNRIRCLREREHRSKFRYDQIIRSLGFLINICHLRSCRNLCGSSTYDRNLACLSIHSCHFVIRRRIRNFNICWRFRKYRCCEFIVCENIIRFLWERECRSTLHFDFIRSL